MNNTYNVENCFDSIDEEDMKISLQLVNIAYDHSIEFYDHYNDNHNYTLTTANYPGKCSLDYYCQELIGNSTRSTTFTHRWALLGHLK